MPEDETLKAEVDYLKHQNTTILVLSAVNMFANLMTILIAFLVGAL